MIYRNIVKPTLVLVVILAVVTAAVVATYNLTAVNSSDGLSPDIRALAESALGVNPELVKNAGFDAKVTAAFRGSGGDMAIFVTSKGYGGDMELMVTIAPDGAVREVVIRSDSETPGIGTKVRGQDFLGRFVGKIAPASDQNTEVVAGASISSRAVISGVAAAQEAFTIAKGAE